MLRNRIIFLNKELTLAVSNDHSPLKPFHACIKSRASSLTPNAYLEMIYKRYWKFARQKNKILQVQGWEECKTNRITKLFIAGPVIHSSYMEHIKC